MCIIIHIPNGQNITDEIFHNAWDNNDHGGGYMFADGKEVIIRKPFFDEKEMLAAFRADQERTKSPFVLHFRIATHGLRDEVNTHPHRVNKRLAFVHNGILSVGVPKNSPYSDTVIFRDTILATLKTGWWNDADFIDQFGQVIGSSNKMSFMWENGAVIHINEDSGIWRDGCWYSNYSAFTCYYYSSGTALTGEVEYYRGSMTRYRPIYSEYKCQLCDDYMSDYNVKHSKKEYESLVCWDCERYFMYHPESEDKDWRSYLKEV